MADTSPSVLDNAQHSAADPNIRLWGDDGPHCIEFSGPPRYILIDWPETTGDHLS